VPPGAWSCQNHAGRVSAARGGGNPYFYLFIFYHGIHVKSFVLQEILTTRCHLLNVTNIIGVNHGFSIIVSILLRQSSPKWCLARLWNTGLCLSHVPSSSARGLVQKVRLLPFFVRGFIMYNYPLYLLYLDAYDFPERFHTERIDMTAPPFLFIHCI